jgi:hypothetical protein
VTLGIEGKNAKTPIVDTDLRIHPGLTRTNSKLGFINTRRSYEIDEL